MSGIVRDSRIGMDTWWHVLRAEQRDQLRAFISRHTDARFITEFEYDIIDAPLMRITCLVKTRNPAGQYVSQIDPDCKCSGWNGQPIHLWKRTVEFVLREPLPDWWQPGTVNLTKETA